MKTFKIYYYVEHNDECVDLEIEIKAENIFSVEEKFRKEVRVFKKVYRIEEKPFNKQ